MPEFLLLNGTIYWGRVSATLPPHVNINYLEMMPSCQAFGPLAVRRANAAS
jgi:hypothetical protein